MDNTVLVPVIICGGGGSRLWPISRRSFAKPFVSLPGQSHSLLAQTYARLQHAPSPKALITVAAATDLFLCKEIAAAHAPAAAAHLFIGEPGRTRHGGGDFVGGMLGGGKIWGSGDVVGVAG